MKRNRRAEPDRRLRALQATTQKEMILNLKTMEKIVCEGDSGCYAVWSADSSKLIVWAPMLIKVIGLDGKQAGETLSSPVGNSIPAFTKDGVWYENM